MWTQPKETKGRHCLKTWTRTCRSQVRGVSCSVQILRSNEATATRTSKRAIGLINKTTSLHVHHAFFYISLPFLHDYDMKMPNFAFYGGRKQATTKVYFSFWIWMQFTGIQFQDGSPTFWQSKWVGIIAIKTERTQIHFLSDVLFAVASLDLKVPSNLRTQPLLST